MKNTVLFQKSNGEYVLLPMMTIGDIHEIIFWRTTLTKTSPSASLEEKKAKEQESRLWVKLFLKNKFPELNEYDREAAFITVYQVSIVRSIDRLPASCPRCKSTNPYVIDMQQKSDRSFHVTFPADNLLWKVNFRLPSTIGGTDGGPETLEILGKEQYQAEELEEYGIEPTYGDECLVDGERVPWDPTQDFTVLYHEDKTKYPIQELPDDMKSTLRVHMKEYNSFFKHKSFTPFVVNASYRCKCGFRTESKITSVYDFLMKTLSDELAESQFFADYSMAVALSETGVMNATELSNLNRIEFSIIQGIAIKRSENNKEKQG